MWGWTCPVRNGLVETVDVYLVARFTMVNRVEALCKIDVNQVDAFAGVYQPCDPFLSEKEVERVGAM